KVLKLYENTLMRASRSASTPVAFYTDLLPARADAPFSDLASAHTRDPTALRRAVLSLAPTSATTSSLSSPSASMVRSDDVLVCAEELAFACPLLLRRVRDPARGLRCRHLQAVDAEELIIDTRFLALLHRFRGADGCIVRADGTADAVRPRTGGGRESGGSSGGDGGSSWGGSGKDDDGSASEPDSLLSDGVDDLEGPRRLQRASWGRGRAGTYFDFDGGKLRRMDGWMDGKKTAGRKDGRTTRRKDRKERGKERPSESVWAVAHKMPQPPTVALVAIAVAAVAAAVAAEAPPAVAPSLLHKPQQTVALPSSSSFELTPCYGHGTFQCTRFDVPLNWATANEDIGGADADMMVESGDDDEPPTRMQIAVIKLPAKVPVTHPQYGGAVFLNPGGPGESGVEQVLTTGHHVQTILDHPAPPLTPAEVQAWLVAANKNRSAAATAAAPPPLPPGKYFDVYGFDPRGVGVSTPHLPCFAGPVAHAAWRATALLDYAVVWHSDPAIGLHLAAADSLVKSCSAGRRGRAIFRALNTPQVVEDLLAMVEAHGEWREREARRLLLPLLQKADADGPDSAADASADTSDALTRTAWLHGREQLQYWGVSYGTLLGQTFAAMHPDRVARVVIDGVMDPDDYYAGAWRKNLNDADGIMHTLADLCYRAGPERCPLHTGGSGRDVEDRAWKIVQNLKAAPLPVPVSGRVPGTPQQQLLLWPEMVTYGDVTLQILSALAFPHTEAERVFGLLAELEAGNGTALALAKQAVRAAPPPVSPACAAAGDFSDACLADAYVSLSGTMQAIECMDSASSRQARNEMAPLPRHELHEYLDFLFAQSRWYAAPWAFYDGRRSRSWRRPTRRSRCW
ncbi:hypothetical protein HK405_006461, partial [Cladochytrium tenue]